MGLADRDYMQRRAALRSVSASGAPEPSAGLTLWMIVLFIGVTYGAYTAWRWWQTGPARPPVRMVAPPAEQPRQPSARNVVAPQLSSRQPPTRSERSGASSSEAAVPDSPADNTVRITKCVVNGVTSYSDGECPPQAARTTVTVNTRQNLADGLPSARSYAQPTAAAEPPVASTGPSVVDPNVQKKNDCLAIEEEIKSIDARARQPLPGWEQDRLAAKRKLARDAQFRLRC